MLGIVEGDTEFLPISSTGHLTIVEKLMGLPLGDAAVTAFTAVIQTGSVPIGVVGFLAKNVVSGPLRNLWVVAGALIAWSAVMYLAKRVATSGAPKLRSRCAMHW